MRSYNFFFIIILQHYSKDNQQNVFCTNFLNNYTKVKRSNVLSIIRQEEKQLKSRQVTGQGGTRKNLLMELTYVCIYIIAYVCICVYIYVTKEGHIFFGITQVLCPSFVCEIWALCVLWIYICTVKKSRHNNHKVMYS